MRYCLIVESDAAENQDEALAWVDSQHIPDVLRTEGFVSAERFFVEASDQGPAKNMIIYEVETPDLTAMQAELARRRAVGDLPSRPNQPATNVRITACKAAAAKVFRSIC